MNAWIADPSIVWRICLTAELEEPPQIDAVGRALADLHRAQGWPGAGILVVGDEPAVLRGDLGGRPGLDLAVGVAGSSLVVSAHHSRVDGLGLLSVLAALIGSAVTSSARGVDDRPDQAGFAGTVVRRLTEVATAPPAAIVGTRPQGPSVGDHRDRYAETAVPGRVRTADLVAAATRGVGAYNAGAGARARHVAVAIGVSRTGDPAVIEDRSALIRLTDTELMSTDQIAGLLRTAPTQHAVGSGPGLGAVVRSGLRLLSRRLGSTLLVSHLGTVTAPGVRRLVFHPVTAGGTGLALGAVTLGDSTVLALRGRGATWQPDALERLLHTIVSEAGPGEVR